MHTPESSSPLFLSGGGEMGALIRAFDWSKTSLGPPETWPQSLCTSVSVCLNSRFPILVWWGRELIMIYNDSYRRLIGATKHPQAMGSPGQAIWPEIWSIIGPMLESVLDCGEATWSENQLLLLERNGYPEECYFTFSYSPIREESGRVGGVFTAVTETTKDVVGERQLNTLKDLGKIAAASKTLKEVYDRTLQVLHENRWDFPFVCLYEVEKQGTSARRVGCAPRELSETAAPAHVDFDGEGTQLGLLPPTAGQASQIEVVEGLIDRLGTLPAGAWSQSPDRALVIPVAQSGQRTPFALLVVGANPHRLPDDAYQGFFRLVADQIATSVANVRAYEEERRRAEALREIDRAKTTFFSNVSHEFRTPLTLMLGPLEEAIRQSKGSLAQPLRDDLRTAHRNALRLQKLVNTLLDFSRIEAGRLQAHYQPVELGPFTAELASNFQSAIQKAGMELVVDCPPLAEPVYVDREMWEKIVLNLLSNAFKYTLAGRITVGLRLTNGAAELRVMDTGVGIPADELPRLFERFHRVAGTRGRSHEGTGIGLSLIYELVALHGGTLTAESEPGVGSTFVVRIPLGTAHLAHSQVVDPPSATELLPTKSSLADVYRTEVESLLPSADQSDVLAQPVKAGPVPTAHILFADDNADMRAYVSRLLQPHFRVTTVPDGRAALAAVSQEVPDLVLTDVMMPELDGFGLLKALKANPQTAPIPVVLLSARAGEEATLDGYEAGADDYLVKPFSANELLGRIRAQLAAAQIRMETRRQLQTVLQQAPVGIAQLEGPEFTFTLANEHYCRIARRPATRLLGRTFLEAFPELEGQHQNFTQLLRSIRQTGQPMAVPDRLVQLEKDGILQDFYFTTLFHPLTNSSGQVTSILVVSHDVTDQVVARQKTEASGQQLQTLFGQAPVGIAILRGPEHTFELANDFYVRFVGRHQADEIVGKPLLEALPEIEGQGFFEMLTQVVQSGEPIVFTEQPVDLVRNGQLETGYFTFTYQPLIAPDSGVFVIAVEVTDSVRARQKIEENEERLRLAVESAELGTWDYDPQADVIQCSPRTVELFGFSPGETLRLDQAIQAIVEADRQRVLEAIDEALRPDSGGNYDVEYTLANYTDGLLRTIQARGKVFFDEQGTATRFIGTARDVTDRTRAEAALRESEERYRTLFESMDQGYCTVKVILNEQNQPVDYRFETINPAFAELTGLPENAAGKTAHELVPDLEDFWIQTYGRVALTGEAIRFENQSKPMNRWFDVYALRIGAAEERRVGILFTNITERKRTDDALRAANERAQTIAQATNDAIWDWDLSTDHLTWNDGVRSLFGYPPEEVIETISWWYEHIHPDDRAVVVADIHQIIDSGGQSWVHEYRFLNRDGSVSEVSDRGYVLRDAWGKPYRMLGGMTNITERKRREANLAFLADVGNDLARFSTPEEIIETVGAKIGAYLQVTSCLIGDIDEANDEVRIEHTWQTPDSPDLRGVYRISEFVSQELSRAAHAGEPFVVEDTSTDLRTNAVGYGAYRIHSFISVPARRGTEWKFLFTVNSPTKRQWQPDEIQLLEELTSRLFPRLERARAEAALRESEEISRMLADNISQLAWMTDADGWIFWYNRRWYEYTGTTFEEMQGWGWQAVHAPEEVERVTAKFKQHIALGEIWEDTFPLRSKEGEYRWFLSRAVPIRDDAGKVLRWFGTNTDITDRIRADEALRESDRWFRQLADSMPQIVWTARPDGFLDYYNQRWYDYIGNDLGFGDAGWVPILHPDDRQPCLEHWHVCLQTGEPYQFEFRLADVRNPGTYRWYLARATAFRDEQGTILKWFGTCTDINDQKKAEATLRESEDRFRAVADSAPVMIWISDTQKLCTYFSKGWLEFSGRSMEEEIGNGWAHGIHPDDLDRCVEVYTTHFDARKEYHVEYRMRRHDGEYRWVSDHGVPRYLEDGTFLGYIGGCTDIHESRLAKEELEQVIARRTQELRDLNADLERSNLDLMQFAYVASHDLKEPLRKIQMFGSLLERELKESLTDRAKQHLDVMTNSSARMQLLVEDVLNLSRLSQLDAAYERVDLNAVVEAIISDLQLLIQEKGARINVNALPQIEAVPGQMHQLFQNLISNGLKFNESPVPVVTIQSVGSPEGTHVVIEVSDNGIGFAEQFKEKMFRMFQRLNGRVYAGTGIGLTICRKIVENHRGTIEAESQLGEGATFRVRLPVRNVNQE